MKMRKLAVILVLLIASTGVRAVETVKEFRGSGNTTTSIFTVESPWLLDWRVDGDYYQLVALDVTLVEAHTGRYVGRVLHTQRNGNGLKLFNHAGQFRLRISSMLASWTIKIKQIKPEEEKLYKPKNPN